MFTPLLIHRWNSEPASGVRANAPIAGGPRSLFTKDGKAIRERQAGSPSNDWTAILAASDSSTGAKTTTEQGKRLARENLQLVLFLNLLKLAEMFPREPDRLSLYMQQHLLEIPTSADDEEPPPAPPTPPNP